MIKQTLLLSLSAAFSMVHAATIAQWKELNPNPAIVPISGGDTDSPTFGDGTANSAQAAWIAGHFGTGPAPASVTLEIGQTLTVSGNLILTGGTNNDNQFRFGVFNDGGQFALDDGNNWIGGWLHSIGTAASSDLYRGRTDGAYISTAGNAQDLNAIIARSGTFDGDSTNPFTFSLSVTRDSAMTIDVTTLVTGGDGNLSEQYVENDIATDLFTYNTVGVLFGGSSGVEQASFSGVQYQVIPEPSGALLATLGLVALAARRLRRSH